MSDGRFIPFFFCPCLYSLCVLDFFSISRFDMQISNSAPLRAALAGRKSIHGENAFHLCELSRPPGQVTHPHTHPQTQSPHRAAGTTERKKRSGNLQREEKRRLYKWYVWFYRKARIFLQRTTMNFSYLNWETALCGGGGGDGVW